MNSVIHFLASLKLLNNTYTDKLYCWFCGTLEQMVSSVGLDTECLSQNTKEFDFYGYTVFFIDVYLIISRLIVNCSVDRLST